jgi:hypothetical protein
MKDNILIAIFLSICMVLCSVIIFAVYKNFKPEITIEERIEQCKRLGLKVVSIDLHNTYSTVDCREE